MMPGTEIGEVRAGLAAIDKRLDRQDAIIDRIDERTRAMELRLAGEDGHVRAAQAGRGRMREWAQTVLGPTIGAVAGGLLVKFWP